MQKNNFAALFRDSAAELKKLPALVTCAMLMAVGLVLAGLSIDITPWMRISFAYLANAVIGLLFGPVPAMLTGALGNCLGYFVHPSGPFYPVYTLIAMFSGFLYGIFLYHSPLKLSRVIGAKACVTVFSNLLFNTLCNAALYGKSFFAILPLRILKNAACFPIEVVLLFVVCKIALQAYTTSTARLGTSAGNS